MGRRRGGAATDGPDGLLVLDKPTGMTSHDVVARVRRALGTRRVGHAGTLDPMATGVLLVGVGRVTRLLTYLVGADKDYRATIRLGVATGTDDAEGEVTSSADAHSISPLALESAVAALTGEIAQVPSAVSAIKVDGVRSYARVRAGEEVRLAARPVTVSRFQVLSTRHLPHPGLPGASVLDVEADVAVSSGTYVRALARDLGSALRVGGHLTALRRTRVGAFEADAALALPDLQTRGAACLIPAGEVAARCFTTWVADEQSASRLAHGQRLALEALPRLSTASVGVHSPGTASALAPIAALSPDGHLVALVGVTDGVARPLLVLSGS